LKLLAGLSLLVAGVLFVSPIAAQSLSRSAHIRLINGFAAGGGSDLLARALAKPLAAHLGQHIIVENRVGAGGVIATESVAKAPPDGHTLIVGSSAAFSIAPNLMLKCPYDPVKDFTPIGYYATFPYALVVNQSLPVKSVPELIAAAKARPNELNFGTAGARTSTHLAFEQFMLLSHTKLTHVPYKGNGPATLALIGGEVQVGLEGLLESAQHVRQGRVRAIGVTSLKRSPMLPNVPTISESGMKGFEVENWQGIFGPAGMPRSVVDRLNTGIKTVMARPEMVERLGGGQPLSGSPEDLAGLLQRELAKMAELVRKAGIQKE
jgi:tripartite-type tricarboxylate transporter receptor subunit TctC